MLSNTKVHILTPEELPRGGGFSPGLIQLAQVAHTYIHACIYIYIYIYI